jgi:hypothetical protein
MRERGKRDHGKGIGKSEKMGVTEKHGKVLSLSGGFH